MLSIMHYNQFAFSKNIGEQTITPKDTNVKGDELGQRFGLTKTDSAQINAAYVSICSSFLKYFVFCPF